jgi:nucleoside phosphorylase
MSNPGDYTVGWICAVATESVAARVFLDDEHEGPEYVSPNDNNHYTLGKVEKHNVVIASLPDGEYGIASAASVARDLLHSFPNVRIGLMVGIGGGAPSPKHDIRLGDIVVSVPRDGKGGLFQYDFGKTIQDQRFRPTGFLNQPPTVLRTAVNGLKVQYESDGHRLKETINSIFEKKKRLRRKYKRPDSISDRLYQSGFIHPFNDEGSCAAVCGDDPSNLIIRPERTEDDDDPTIHYGLIASADQLMKDASVRDTLAKEKDVLCFEMEAAGLMNHFPCLVIRGICDYSDTHKNKEWQGYASMAAAAYAKDLLCRIHPNRVEAEKSIQEIVSSGQLVRLRENMNNLLTKLPVEKGINEIREAAQGIGINVRSLGADHKQGKIERWLQAPDSSTAYNKALQQRHEGSGRWFLESTAFAEWEIRRNSFLWLYGIPGCGKTILSSTIVQHLESTLPSQPLLYFFFTFTEPDKQSLESMIRSLIGQLYYKREDVQKHLDSLFSACADGHRQPTTDSLCTTFLQMIQQVGEVWILLDALDECHTRKGKRTEGMLSWMRDLLSSEERNVHVLMASRPEQDIDLEVRQWARRDGIVPIQGDGVADDIRAYIHTRIRQDDDLKRWRSHPDIQDEIEARLMEKAAGM